MASVLIVDDVQTDRRIVERLVAKDPTLHPKTAETGTRALEMMAMSPPNIVITDLIMPEMDGLELVEAIREQHTFVPVILMTSHGSENIAIRALRSGAVSYVPKILLARDLVETIHKVLTISNRPEIHDTLGGHLSSGTYTYVLDNNPALIGSLVGFLQEQMTQLNLFDETERIQIGVALEEVLVNALHHGNLELSSSLKESDLRHYYALLDERRIKMPYRDRRIFVTARLSPVEAAFTIRDEGPGFDPATIPDPTNTINLEKVSGRGLLLVRTFMDKVKFGDLGNEISMSKEMVDHGGSS